jgi:asparagine synthase
VIATSPDLRIRPVEIATGIVFGTVPGPVAPALAAEPAATALEALERECLRALTGSPCLVSFSGGVDSSLVLAAATRVARREGLPLPVPATNRFASAPDSDESDWQELVVRRLGLDDWLRFDLTDELDVVGPVATRGLRRHGLLWPFNAHFHAPLLEAAEGGALLTGIGGDELFGVSRWDRAGRVVTAQVRPRARDLPRVALLAAPRPVRRAVLRRRVPAELPWLTREGQAEFASLWATHEAAEPARLAQRVHRLQRGRVFGVGLRSLDLLARDAGARISHPLASPGFASAVAAAAPRLGYRWRGEAVQALFDGLLPAELLTRRTKACFDAAFWGAHSAALAASWDGSGVDERVVDVERLRAVWAATEPDSHTFLLLQAAWLERERRSMKNVFLAARPVVTARDVA